MSNGLRVVLLSDKRQPLVAVRMTYLSGTATDPNRRPGLAHLTEHLAFSPTRHIQQDLLHATLDLGASDLNGQTSNDRIEYFATVPSNRLEQLLWLESERMGFSLENFTEDYLKKEQRIVRREIALREGRGLAFLRHRNRFLYPKKHPLHDLAEQEPERASLSDVQAFFQGTHRPDNAVLAIVGDIQVTHAKRLVEKYFAPIVNPPVPRLTVEIPDVEKPRKEERQLIFHGWARTEVGLDFVLPRVRDLKRLSCYLLIMLHWRDELEKGLVESNYLASGLGTGLSWGFRPTLLGSTIYSPLNVRPDVVAKKSVAITHSALSEVKKILARRRALKLQISSSFQDLQDKSVSFTEEVVVYGRAFSLGERLRIVDSITADDINRVLSEDFGRTSLRTSLFAPGGESAEGELYR